MNESLKDKIIGTWQLLSWTFVNEKGEDVHYFGENARGILMYDRCGYMNAQLMKAHRPLFASDSISGGSAQEAHGAFHSYLAYYGKYYEQEPGVVVHIVEGSLFPNWTGNKEVRYGKIENDRLVLSTPPIQAQHREIVFSILWERMV